MKKALLFTLAAAVVVGTTAQTNAQEKGKFWIGGQFGYESTESFQNMPVNSLTVAPEFGYNLSDRWGVGIEVGLTNANTRNTYTTILPGVNDLVSSWSSHVRTWSVAPFARYTFARWRALRLYADGGVFYEHAVSKSKGSNSPIIVGNPDGGSDGQSDGGRWQSGDLIFQDYPGGQSDGSNDSGVTSRGGGIFINPGFAIHVTKCLALSGSVNLLSVGASNSGKNTPNSHDDTKTLKASLNSPFASGAIRLGFHVTF